MVLQGSTSSILDFGEKQCRGDPDRFVGRSVRRTPASVNANHTTIAK